MRSIPGPSTHDPNEYSSSDPGEGMSGHEANRRTQEMIRQIEQEWLPPSSKSLIWQ